jgi:hypothetical protein
MQTRPPHSDTVRRHAAQAGAGLADGAALADGPARDALRESLHQLDIAEAFDTPSPAARAIVLCEAHTGVARALAGLHAYGPAETHLGQALRCAAVLGGHDLAADLHCAWAEVATNAADLADAQDATARCRAARDRARDHAFEAVRLASAVTDPNWELRVVLRASDVLERCGDHDDAVQLQQRALQLLGLGHCNVVDDGGEAETGQAADAGPPTTPGALM